MVVGSCGEWMKPRSSCGLRCSLPYFLWLKHYPGVCGLVRSWLQMTPVCRSDSQLINSVLRSRFFPLFSLPTIDSDLLTACIFHAVSLPVVWWAGALAELIILTFPTYGSFSLALTPCASESWQPWSKSQRGLACYLASPYLTTHLLIPFYDPQSWSLEQAQLVVLEVLVRRLFKIYFPKCSL